MMNHPKEVWALSFTPFDEKGALDLDTVDPLVDFYVAAGSAGIFAMGATGEVGELDASERHALADRMARRLKGRCPLAASGNFAATLDGQAKSLMALRERGVDIPVIMLSLLPQSDRTGEQLLDLAGRTEGPLGLYESFGPGHRMLTPEETAHVARTGRFVFMKETSCDLATVVAKVKASEKTSLKVLQANLERLPASIEAGGPGFCGVVGSVCPSLVLQCCNAPDPSERRKAHSRLMALQAALRDHAYPASGKYLLSKAGIPIKSITRSSRAAAFSPSDTAALDSFAEAAHLFI